MSVMPTHFNYPETEAMNRLFNELDKGLRSTEEDDWFKEEEVREHFCEKRYAD